LRYLDQQRVWHVSDGVGEDGDLEVFRRVQCFEVAAKFIIILVKNSNLDIRVQLLDQWS